MEKILEWGIEIVLWFQQFSPGFDLMFKIFTFSGEEMFYLLFLPVIIWCISMRFGVRLMILFLFNAYFNSFAKLIVDQPRPFNIDNRVKQIVHASGGGLPSGHTQNALVFWTYLARHFKHKWLWILTVVMIIFVPMSRVYLGVHFPTDLLGGYILGIIVLLLFIKLDQPVTDWLKKRGLGLQLIMSLLIPILMIMMLPSPEPSSIAACAVLLGGCVGISFERKWIKFKTPDTFLKKLACYLIGTIILFAFLCRIEKSF